MEESKLFGPGSHISKYSHAQVYVMQGRSGCTAGYLDILVVVSSPASTGSFIFMEHLCSQQRATDGHSALL